MDPSVWGHAVWDLLVDLAAFARLDAQRARTLWRAVFSVMPCWICRLWALCYLRENPPENAPRAQTPSGRTLSETLRDAGVWLPESADPGAWARWYTRSEPFLRWMWRAKASVTHKLVAQAAEGRGDPQSFPWGNRDFCVTFSAAEHGAGCFAVLPFDRLLARCVSLRSRRSLLEAHRPTLQFLAEFWTRRGEQLFGRRSERRPDSRARQHAQCATGGHCQTERPRRHSVELPPGRVVRVSDRAVRGEEVALCSAFPGADRPRWRMCVDWVARALESAETERLKLTALSPANPEARKQSKSREKAQVCGASWHYVPPHFA